MDSTRKLRPDVLLPRRMHEVIDQRLTEEPAVVVVGPRAAGKSVVLDAVAETYGVNVTDLDDLEARAAVANDPMGFVADRPGLVCVDEFQHAPVLLDAIKAELNKDLRPGRFLLTGSTRYSTLPAASQSLTGRVHRLALWPMSQGELRGIRETFVEDLLQEPERLMSPELARTSRHEYEAAILAGGMPLAVSRPTVASRNRWFGDYVTTVVDRDVLGIRKVRQRHVLPQVLRQLAARTGGVLNVSDIAGRVGIDKTTAGDFIGLLEDVFLVHRLDGFGRTLSKRATAAPKVHVVDSGLAAWLVGLDEQRLAARGATALSEFGHVTESFVVGELLKQASWLDEQFTFSHYRSKDRHEVDLVIETRGGKAVGVEVKAASAASPGDFRGLIDLREKLGGDFVAGVVVTLGQHSYQYQDRLFVVPLERLWQPPEVMFGDLG